MGGEERRLLPYRFGRGGDVLGGEERCLLPSRFEKRYVACPGPLPGSRWPAGARPARRSRTGTARLRTGGEDESARTGDSNPGCNYSVRGYSPSMHFLWGGDMPHYSPPLPFRRGRAGCPCVLASPRGRPARGSRTCVLAGVPRPAPSHPLGCDSPAFFSPVFAPLLAEFFSFLTDISV